MPVGGPVPEARGSSNWTLAYKGEETENVKLGERSGRSWGWKGRVDMIKLYCVCV